MHLAVFVVLLSICLPSLCTNLTYPIKGMYFGFQANLGDYNKSILPATISGYNLLIITFYSDKVNDYLQNYDDLSLIQQRTFLRSAQNNNVAVLMGYYVGTKFGQLAIGYDAVTLGKQAANQVLLRDFDGIDIWIRETGQGFTIGDKNSSQSIDWFVQLITTIRQNLGPTKIITVSPYANNFGPIAGSGVAGPLGGMTAVHPRISNMIQHYNIFYSDMGDCFTTYETMFETSGCGFLNVAIKQIHGYANISYSQMVLAKPITPAGGYVSPSNMHAILAQANSTINYTNGVVGWTWMQNISDVWLETIFPSGKVTPAPTIMVNATLAPPASSSGASSSEESSDPGNSGLHKSTILIIAIVVPILFVAIVLIVFLVIRRRPSSSMRKAYAPERMDSMGSISLPELEKDYQSTNLVTDYNSIVIKKRLGQGGSGIVNMGVWRHIDVAVKEFTNQDIATTDFIRESEIHAKLRHPNIVQLLAICLPPQMCTISEFMAKGSLADVLESKNAKFTWTKKIRALHDIAKGMAYLHESKIIHRDLKSQNVLIDKNWTCKIADFGTSKLVNEANATATAYVPRTAQWSAPEVITKGEYSEKSDTYSFGIIMWEVYTGLLPYDGMFAFQVEDRTVRGSRLTIPVGCEAWYEALMQECWSGEASQRPTFESVLAALPKSNTTS